MYSANPSYYPYPQPYFSPPAPPQSYLPQPYPPQPAVQHHDTYTAMPVGVAHPNYAQHPAYMQHQQHPPQPQQHYAAQMVQAAPVPYAAAPYIQPVQQHYHHQQQHTPAQAVLTMAMPAAHMQHHQRAPTPTYTAAQPQYYPPPLQHATSQQSSQHSYQHRVFAPSIVQPQTQQQQVPLQQHIQRVVTKPAAVTATATPPTNQQQHVPLNVQKTLESAYHKLQQYVTTTPPQSSTPVPAVTHVHKPIHTEHKQPSRAVISSSPIEHDVVSKPTLPDRMSGLQAVLLSTAAHEKIESRPATPDSPASAHESEEETETESEGEPEPEDEPEPAMTFQPLRRTSATSEHTFVTHRSDRLKASPAPVVVDQIDDVSIHSRHSPSEMPNHVMRHSADIDRATKGEVVLPDGAPPDYEEMVDELPDMDSGCPSEVSSPPPRRVSGSKPYKCTIENCDRAFTLPHHLRLHIERGHGDGALTDVDSSDEKAADGDDAFVTENDAKQNESLMHVESGEDTTPADVDDVDDPARPFVCRSKLCRKRYTAQTSLERHYLAHDSHRHGRISINKHKRPATKRVKVESADDLDVHSKMPPLDDGNSSDIPISPADSDVFALMRRRLSTRRLMDIQAAINADDNVDHTSSRADRPTTPTTNGNKLFQCANGCGKTFGKQQYADQHLRFCSEQQTSGGNVVIGVKRDIKLSYDHRSNLPSPTSVAADTTAVRTARDDKRDRTSTGEFTVKPDLQLTPGQSASNKRRRESGVSTSARDGEWYCNTCETYFSGRFSLIRHQRRAEHYVDAKGVVDAEWIVTDDSKDGDCHVCHDGGVLYCCDQCPHSFHLECALYKGQRVNNFDAIPDDVVCSDLIDAVTRRALKCTDRRTGYALQAHFAVTDPSQMEDLVQLHECTNCDRTFNSGKSLKIHIGHVHRQPVPEGAEDKIYQCSIPGCERVFSRRNFLSQHLARHR